MCYDVLLNMKLVLLILSIVPLTSFAADSVEAYRLKVKNAVNSKNLESIKDLYSWDGIEPVLRARELMIWKHPFKVLSDKYQLKEVLWTERKNFPEITRKFIVNNIEVDGVRFSMNHKVVGQVTVVWKMTDKPAFHTMGIFVANVDGKYVGVSLRTTIDVKK